MDDKFQFHTYTPPSQSNQSTSADATAEANALTASRAEAGRVAKPPKRLELTTPAAGSGPKLPDPADPSRIWRLEPRVRMMLAVTEFVSQLKVEAKDVSGKWTATATMGGKPWFHVVRPTADMLLHDRRFGIIGVLNAKQHRKDRIDEIQVQRFGVETHVLQLMDRPAELYPAMAELAQVTIEIATVLVQQLKHHLVVPRPHEVSQDADPVIDVPGHFSFPGGHALQAMAVVEVAGAAAGEDPDGQRGLRKVAMRIAHNRVVAGLHYPLDSFGGLALGWLLARLLVSASSGPAAAELVLDDADELDWAVVPAESPPAPALPLFAALWDRAHEKAPPTP